MDTVLKECVDCGCEFTTFATSTRSIRCQPCQDRRTLERQAESEYIRQEYTKRDTRFTSRFVVVVEYDPIPVEQGGFSKGAPFIMEEWECMKRHKHSPGLTVRFPDGRMETI